MDLDGRLPEARRAGRGHFGVEQSTISGSPIAQSVSVHDDPDAFGDQLKRLAVRNEGRRTCQQAGWLPANFDRRIGHSLVDEALLAKVEQKSDGSVPELLVADDLQQVLGMKTFPKHLQFDHQLASHQQVSLKLISNNALVNQFPLRLVFMLNAGRPHLGRQQFMVEQFIEARPELSVNLHRLADSFVTQVVRCRVFHPVLFNSRENPHHTSLTRRFWCRTVLPSL